MREKLKNTIKITQKKIRKYELKTLELKLDAIQKNIDKYSVKIIFTGRFNAGKSALINKILGRDIMEEGQLPTTAIATEVIYDKDEYIEAVSGNASSICPLQEEYRKNGANYDFLVMHLNCSELKKYDGYTLVDMPGFDSKIEAHNKAILRYAMRGSAYILVIDCEDGTIKQSTLNCLKELKNYDDNIAVVITKGDLKLPSEIEQIENSIIEKVRLHFDGRVPVITTSKKDTGVQIKMRNLIRQFDKEQIFYQQFAPQIYEIGNRCIDAMEIYKKGIRLDLSEYENEIRKHESAKKKLEERLNREKRKAVKNSENIELYEITAKIQRVLFVHVDSLADSLKTSENEFYITVNSILRPVLLNETYRYADQKFNSVVSDIAGSVSEADESLEDVVNHVLGKLQETNNWAKETMQSEHHTWMTTVATVFATVADAVEPLLKLIAIFLPDILNMVLKKKKEKMLKDKVMQMIPEIVAGLQLDIEKTLADIKEDVFHQLEMQIFDMIKSEEEALEKAKDAKIRMVCRFDKKIAEIQSDIDELRNAMEEMI